jgi:adenylosuccinate lyase
MSCPLSPLDGRYRERLSDLAGLFSEEALVRSQCIVELRYLELLSTRGLFPPLPASTVEQVRKLEDVFGPTEFAAVKAIEAETNHDVKACELFIRQALELPDPNAVHFGLTSEDVNNLAYSLLLDRYRLDVQVPRLKQLMETLAGMAMEWKGKPFPARTHGQMASPTTAGKELAVFLARLDRQLEHLEKHRFSGKLNGATGNYSAMVAAFPDTNWRSLSRTFVEGLQLAFNPITTQIESHDSWCEYFDVTRRINQVVLDLDVDMWLYISHGCFKQRAVPGEVGSSTMPHKVNPINFENSEGNLVLSNSLLVTLSDRLSHSRMQRDLSDSTVERNMGVALGHAHLAIGETIKGLGKVELDRDECRRQIGGNLHLLSEPIQSILRTRQVERPYELLKGLSRGKEMDPGLLEQFIESLAVDADVKSQLRALSPMSYLGLAEQLCDETVRRIVRERDLCV